MGRYVYDEFRLTLSARADGTYDTLGVGPDGVEHRGTFRLPFDGRELERAVVGVAQHTRSTRDIGGAVAPTMDAVELGGALADSLLVGDIASGYEAAKQHADGGDRGLRLTLSLGGAPALLDVPWELLYRRPTFLANQRRTPVVRHLEVAGIPEPPAIEGTVRILGVIANPADTAPLDVVAERARVEQAVAEVVAAGRVTLDWLQPATPRRLREALRDGTYHVLHYVGHGDFTPEGEGVLYLESADGAGSHTELDQAELASLLGDQASLRLVVLNACDGARTTLTDPFAGVATTLVQLGVPAVVAMQFPISDAAAILFAEELYTNLIGRQAPVDAAVSEARKAIYIEQGSVEWATPVLFMADTEVELWRLGEPRAAGRAVPSPQQVAAAPAPEIAEPPRRRSRAWIVIGVVVLGAAGLGAYLLARPDASETGAVDDRSASAPRGAPASTMASVPPQSELAPLAAPVTFVGTLDDPLVPIEHPIDLAAEQAIYIGGRTPCGPTVEYRLVSPSGNQLGGVPYVCNDMGRVELAESGTWRIVVQSFDGGTGPYDISVTPVPADTVTDADVGSTASGEIAAAGERHYHRFPGAPDQLVYLRGDGPCGAGVAYRLLAPSGTSVSGFPYVCDDVGRVELAETGSYSIEVESYDGGRGVYDVAIIAVPADAITPVAVGATIAGQLAIPGQRDRFVFTATARERVALDGRGPCESLVDVDLISPSGNDIAGIHACGDLASTELPESGEYTLLVEGYGGGGGPYDVALLPG